LGSVGQYLELISISVGSIPLQEKRHDSVPNAIGVILDIFNYIREEEGLALALILIFSCTFHLFIPCMYASLIVVEEN
jgi:hypothetical protein